MPHHDIQSVGLLLEIIHEEVMDLHRKVTQMQVDISKLTAAEQALIGVVEQVLVVVGNQQSALKTLSDQLAAAIAANDPVGNVALQSAIDGMATTLAAETQKVGAALTAATPAAPTGTTGPSGPSGVTGTAGPTGVTGPAAGPVVTPPSTTTPTDGSTGSSGQPATGNVEAAAPPVSPT